MRASFGFLRTRVAKRLLARFLLAALLPALVVAALAQFYVKAQLRRDIDDRVSRGAKLVGLSTLATLEQLESTLRTQLETPGGRLPSRLPGFAVVTHRTISDGLPPNESGQPGRPLTAEERRHLGRGKTLVALGGAQGNTRAVYMAATNPSDPTGQRVLWALIPENALWRSGFEAIKGEGTRLCVVEARRGWPLLCDTPPPVEAQQDLGDIRGGGKIALASWSESGTSMYAASWSVFLRFAYGAEDWRFILSESGETIFASMRGFSLTFAGITVGALLVVFFLSHAQIRRSTEPLEQLQAGTKRLEAGDFSTQVRVESGDEYVDLADSFNRMATTLDRQLVTLRGLDALNQAVLGARDVQPVLEVALARISAVAPGADVLVAAERAPGDRLRGVQQNHLAPMFVTIDVDLTQEDRRELLVQQKALALPPGARRGYLRTGAFAEHDRFTHVLPLRGENTLLGFVAVTSPVANPVHADRLDAIRRLAERLSLALVDVHHVRHLAALSAGTLTAFARAIDANSPWTAGHSERVTALSIAIGERAGLSSDELETLRCGGLLHDIGKIGVPPHILDKAAPLTSAEREVIQRHPSLGAEILAPIGAFTSAIPIVRSHHERMDGTGYPDRLVGENIPFLARVLAVADVFDALVSNRPYRAGLQMSNAILIIQQGTGPHFDPRPVAAFLQAVSDGAVNPIFDMQTSSAHLARVVQASRRVMEDAA